ncbi:hypothetical protein SEA_FORREST_165 [Streptomyces phage Forrest]|uniref:Uncharacterized protein n=2 Tax=Gilsonvirus gilson TaxID=2846398 RepID=A0A7U0GC82_9CAUD|nr:hypothetical protein SEA_MEGANTHEEKILLA_161 [Streptomyces phage MeganTheeKilla]QZE11277.1 hypothetical protein SEA_FORREST_165 [Streptomyces phage Forrest]QZE11503.1 hypothetical protein SEA_JADA_162 [Streptomyces phage Jada]
MMQFTQVDEDAFDVRVNLNTISRIGEAFDALVGSGNADERDEVLRRSFNGAYAKLTQSDAEEVEEADSGLE